MKPALFLVAYFESFEGLISAILRERTLEIAFEGQNSYDKIRTN